MSLKAPAFHILATLSGGDSHGSGIARAVRKQTGGEVQLWPATLYGTLDQLVEEGFIVEIDSERERPEGASRRRRYYRLTRAGGDALAAEAERLNAVATTALSNLAERPWRR